MKDRFTQVLAKLNLTSAALLVSLAMMGCGTLMCLSGIRDEGSINLKASFLEGNLQTGSLGLVVIFVGAFLAMFSLARARPACFEAEVLPDGTRKLKIKHATDQQMKVINELLECRSKEPSQPSPGAYSSKAADGLPGNAQE